MEAGLPNITGSAKQTMVYNSGQYGGNVSVYEYYGALTQGDSFAGENANALSQKVNTIYPLAFDASLSNSIYGNSDTVQPASITTLYLIKY